MQTLALKKFRSYLSPRPRDFDKGKAGHVLIVGGSPGFSGATLLAAEAALRTGAGLVSIATHPAHAAVLNVNRPEVMCHKIESPEELSPLLLRANIIVLGPGLGQTEWSRMLFTTVLHSEKPLLLDADALNLLAKHPLKKSNWVLTPHPGEAARLLQCSITDIQADRVAAIQKLQELYGGTCVLKGAGTLVLAEQPDTIAICKAGNPGMATAGMGDVLSGVIGSLLAQGLPLEIAAKLGVLIHALAGDRTAKRGQRGMIAADLMIELRMLVNI